MPAALIVLHVLDYNNAPQKHKHKFALNIGLTALSCKKTRIYFQGSLTKDLLRSALEGRNNTPCFPGNIHVELNAYLQIPSNYDSSILTTAGEL